MTGGVAPGWYPDYDAARGHERYWDGAQWTERRSGRPAEEPRRPTRPHRPYLPYLPWLLAAVIVLVAISALVLVLGDSSTAPSEGSPPGPASTPGPPVSEQVTPTPATDRRTWRVAAVLDGTTLRLGNDAEVRLVGVVDGCGESELVGSLVGRRVTLVRRGIDKDAAGRLLRYVERNGVDVGKRLIQEGLATAGDRPHARRAVYQRLDDRSPDVC